MAKKRPHTTEEEVSSLLQNYKGEHPSFKLFLIDWQRRHKEYYDNFKARIEAGDDKVFEEIFDLMKSCIPQRATDFFGSLSDAVKNDDKFEESMAPIVDIAEGIDTEQVSTTLSDDQKVMLRTAASELAADGNSEDKADMQQALTALIPAMQLFHLKDVKGFLTLFGDKAKSQDPLLYSMVYFTTLDNGLPTLAKTLIGINAGKEDNEEMAMKNIGVDTMMGASINMGYTRKKGWKEKMKELSLSWRMKLTAMLGMRKGKSGHVRQYLLLEDIILQKTDAVKRIIKKHMSGNAPDLDIAYILIALEETGLVKENVDYVTFHRAVQYFMHKDYGENKAQAAYNDMRKQSHSYSHDEMRAHHYKHAERVIRDMKLLFEKC